MIGLDRAKEADWSAEFFSVKPYSETTKAALYIAPHYRIELRYVPNLIHRAMIRLVFGWRVKVWK